MIRRREFVVSVLGAMLGNLITWPLLHLIGFWHICAIGGCS